MNESMTQNEFARIGRILMRRAYFFLVGQYTHGKDCVLYYILLLVISSLVITKWQRTYFGLYIRLYIRLCECILALRSLQLCQDAHGLDKKRSNFVDLH